MFEALQDFTASLPPWLQWAGIMLAGAIPFVESYFGSVLGVITGLAPPVAVAAAVLGNVASMLVLVLTAHAIRGRTAGEPREPRERSPKRQRLRRSFDKYGVAGVSLLGQTMLPSQITSAALVSFGAPKNTVIFWQIISILLWGIAFGTLAALGVDLLGTP